MRSQTLVSTAHLPMMTCYECFEGGKTVNQKKLLPLGMARTNFFEPLTAHGTKPPAL